MKEMNDKNVVVTGGAGGLGRAVVHALLEAGASIYVPRHEAEPVSNDPLRGLARVTCDFGVDLTDEGNSTDYLLLCLRCGARFI